MQKSLVFKILLFNVVVGTGILHHLNLNKSYSELSSVLHPDRHGIFLEPLGHNFFINAFRKATPQSRTIDEHPLLMKDIELSQKYFAKTKVNYFNLLTLMAVPFRNSKYFEPLYSFLHKLDNSTITILPFLKKYFWIAVLDMSNPKK